MDHATQLAQFLRARRARIKPGDVGIVEVDRRRVPGLRREELAMLAGLSADYYMRLEQGRDHRPSEKVLEALGRALQLDDDATAHLFALGRGLPPVPPARAVREESVRPELHDLLARWTTTPALIHGRWLDVLAANPLARALTSLSEPGTNILRSLFLDARVREQYADPDWVASTAVAYLRANVGGDADDPRLRELVLELSLASEPFCRLWERHDVQSGLSGDTRFHHPSVGTIRLRYQTFAVEGTVGQTLLVVDAAPGSQDARSLGMLAGLTGQRETSIGEPLDVTPTD